jgi:hypothetical protein
VKITVTGFDDGCWASISEVKVFSIKRPSNKNSSLPLAGRGVGARAVSARVPE